MMKSKKTDRFNNDYYLNFTSGKKLYANNISSEIAYNVDWSISWFDVFKKGAGSDVEISSILDTRATSTANFGVFIYSDYNALTQNNSINIELRTTTSETFTSNTYQLPESLHVTNLIVTFESSTRSLKIYKDLQLIGTFTNTVNFESNSPDTSIGASSSGSAARLGGCRDFTIYDKTLTTKECNYIYDVCVPPVSVYPNVRHAYPLNQVPYESVGLYYMRDVANIYNPTATPSDVQLIGWTADELGLGVGGLSDSTTYRGWYDKLNYIPTNQYSKGLNFDSSKQQYLEVTGLEVFDKSEGYTILISHAGDITEDTRMIFSMYDSQNFRYEFYESSYFHEYQTPIPLNNISTIPPYSYDRTNKNFFSLVASNLDYINPYSSTRVSKVVDINCQQNYSYGLRYGNLSLGFDELNTQTAYIGARNGSILFLLGKISFFTIIKGVINKEEEKKIFNNGLYRSPYEVLKDTSKIILDVDLVNPFVDGADIKFTDNSGNCQVVAKQNNGTDWDTLLGVENSIN